MKKRTLIICAAVVTLGIIGNLIPQDEVVETEGTVIQEQVKPSVSETEFNDKIQYFQTHLDNRNNNIATTDIDLIDKEVELCNMFRIEVQDYIDEYTLTEEQQKQLEDIKEEFRQTKESYVINKEKIK